MINRDENGVIESVDKLSDVTEELSEIEKLLSGANKSGIEQCSDDEKASLIKKLNDLKSLISAVTPDIQKAAKPMELFAYIKQVTKIKSAAETFQKLNGDK